MGSKTSSPTLILQRPGRGLFAFLTLFLAALIVFLAIRNPNALFTYLIFASLYTAWAVDALYRRLTVTPDGLVYRRLLSTTAVRWQDLKAIVSAGLISQQESLFAQRDGQSTGPGVTIPLTYFRRSWRSGPLGQLLKEKAPQLFQTSRPQNPAA